MCAVVGRDGNKGVLLIYTGGTIGSMPKEEGDADSPQVVVSEEKFWAMTPAIRPENIKFKVDFRGLEPLDSCNIGPAQWRQIARLIHDEIDNYEGFVVLHGTDTMVYTACALSFMLRNLNKPVILTGAQISHLFNQRNDALQNMVTALMIGNPSHSKLPVIPEVCIYFGGKLLRGNRTRKVNSTGFEAYHSPNYKMLANIGERIEVDSRLLLEPPAAGTQVTLVSTLDPHVVAVHFFPGIQDSGLLEQIIRIKGLKGVILMAYGAGNIPTKPEILREIKSASAGGVTFASVTQCGGGRVELGMYDTSAKLLDIGVVSGTDMTPEAALTKLMVLLGPEDIRPDEVRAKFQQNIAGEQSTSIYLTEFRKTDDQYVDMQNPIRRVFAPNIVGLPMSTRQIDRIILRLRDTVLKADSDRSPVTIKLFRDLGREEPLDETRQNYIGAFNRVPTQQSTMMFFDVTSQMRGAIRDQVTFTIKIEGHSSARMEWGQAELAIFKNELAD